MKKHNTIKIILGTALVCFLLTWIIDAAYYSTEFVNQGKVQMGLFDLFSYSLTSLSYFGYISLFIIVVGGFYGILYKIPAYRNMLDAMANKFKKFGILTISIIMVLLAVITSICGLQFGMFLFFPLIASLILLMGYDKMVVALTLVGSTMVGMIGTTYAFNNVVVINDTLGTSITDNILVKFAILVVALFLLILNTILYIKRNNSVKGNKKKVEAVSDIKEVEEDIVVEKIVEEVAPKKEKTNSKKSTTKSTAKSSTTKSSSKSSSTKSTAKSKKSTTKSKNNNKAAALDEEVIVIKNTEDETYLVPASNDTKTKSWPLIIALLILFVVMILAFIPWNSVFGLDIMSDATEAVNGFKLFKFDLFAKLLGTYNTFGDWMITDMFFPMAFIVFLLSIIYNVKFDDILDGFAAGAKKALTPAMFVLLAYLVLVINTYHPFQLNIYKFILGTADNFNIVTSAFAGIVSSILNVDPSYAFQAVLPYFNGTVTNTDIYPIAGILYQAMYGFSMLFAPTSIILMSTLSYLGLSFKEWFKGVWKLLVELFIIILIICTILVLL